MPWTTLAGLVLISKGRHPCHYRKRCGPIWPSRYDCDPHTEILFDGNAISVIGMSPGNNEPEQFFAGYVADIEHDMGIHNDYFGAE